MGKLKDLTGMKYGRLTVVERRGSNKHGKPLWLCKCDCGNEVVVDGNNLKNGNTNSCGCSRKKDLIGQKFGRLTVIKECGKDKGGSVLWLCKCECGNEKVVDGRNLRRDNTTSCGCLQKEKATEMASKKRLDLIGQRFGRLTVVSLNEEVSKQKKRTYWNCKCDCGNERVIHSTDLRSGYTISCGCYKKDKMKEQMREMVKEMWKDEEMKWKLNYKGGITPISNYLRGLDVVDNWRIRAFIEVDRRCEISGKKVNSNTGEVHHIKPFSEIVREAHVLNSIEIKQIVSDYSEEDLETLKDYIKEWHKDTTNAIVLHKDVHKYFHDVFMKGKGRESSVEDVEEFKQRYLDGEFNDLLGGDLDD